MHTKEKKFVHPYIPNSFPDVQKEMMRQIGISDIDELYAEIPASLRFRGKMKLPPPLLSEIELRKHAEAILAKNRSCQETLSFLGGGCYRHYVPSICDEVNQRSEFLTAYAGEPYEDHGRFQTLFEYESMMAELLNMDVVNVPMYDGMQAASTAIRMAGRITGRNKVMICGAVSPDKLLVIKNYCKNILELVFVNPDAATGKINVASIAPLISSDTAAVYFENPSYFGGIEDHGAEIAALAHKHGALCIVGVDPISLGVLAPPADYGADIACGDIQSLGMHMQYGGGQAGFIATHDKEEFVWQYPSRLFGVESTSAPGEWGFGDVAYSRTSFADRNNCKEFVGTAAALWGITAGVYLSLMGPRGMEEVGKIILQKTRYAIKKLSAIRNVKVRFNNAVFFREFVVDFCGTGKSAGQVNKALLKRNIFGGVDLSKKFPDLGSSALFCVTELHTKQDIDTLADAVRNIVS